MKELLTNKLKKTFLIAMVLVIGIAIAGIAEEDALYVDADGNVGIGTDEPSSALDVVGDLEVGGSDFFVDDSSGNVGIGTTTPGYNLSVTGRDNQEAAFFVETSTNAATNSAQFTLQLNSGTHSGDQMTSSLRGLYGDFMLATYDSSATQWWGMIEYNYSNTDKTLVLAHNGVTIDRGDSFTNYWETNVGIGTLAPESKLHLQFEGGEELEFVDAGSGTANDWIDVQIGDTTGYIRVYSSKE